MKKIIILTILTILNSNNLFAKNINCNKLIEENKCKQFEEIFNKVKESDNISSLKKNYIKNKTDEIAYYIREEKRNPKKQYSKLFIYINKTVKDEKIVSELNIIKDDLWEFLNIYAKSEYYESNYKEEEY